MAMQKLPCLDSTSVSLPFGAKLLEFELVAGTVTGRSFGALFNCAKTKFAGVCSDVVNPAQCGPPVGLNVQSGTVVEGLVW